MYNWLLISKLWFWLFFFQLGRSEHFCCNIIHFLTERFEHWQNMLYICNWCIGKEVCTHLIFFFSLIKGKEMGKLESFLKIEETTSVPCHTQHISGCGCVLTLEKPAAFLVVLQSASHVFIPELQGLAGVCSLHLKVEIYNCLALSKFDTGSFHKKAVFQLHGNSQKQLQKHWGCLLLFLLLCFFSSPFSFPSLPPSFPFFSPQISTEIPIE